MEEPGDGLHEEQRHGRGYGTRYTSLAFGSGWTALGCIDPIYMYIQYFPTGPGFEFFSWNLKIVISWVTYYKLDSTHQYNSSVKNTFNMGLKKWKLKKHYNPNLCRGNGFFEDMLKIRIKYKQYHKRKMKLKNSVLDYITYKKLDCYGHVRRMKKSYIDKCWIFILQEEEREDLKICGCRK